jgi:cobalt-zinc-cadmium resistance protein CzcA
VFATLTVTPVLSSVILPAHVDEIETLFVRAIRFFYESILPILVRRHKSTLTIAVAFLLACGAIATRLGTEFLPKLEEGNLWIRASLPPTISLEAGVQTVTRIREIIKSYPEAVTVFSNHGRGEDGTDPTGSFNAEFFVPLQPFDEWPAGMTKERLVAELSEKLNRELIGVDFNFSQYIQDNIEETLSGVKGENSVKIFGAELAQLQDLAHRAKTELEKVPGVREPGEFNLLGQPNLIIAIDRDKAVRFGIAVADINTVVQAAIGGQEVTRVYEGERNFAVTVRLSSAYRTNVEAIKSIPVAVAPSDPKSSVAYIPLSDLANVRIESGASFIYRENGQRYVPIKYSVRERDLGSTVADAQRALAEHLPLPEGHRLEWAGEFGALQEAKARLFTIVPLGLVLIVMILFALFNSMRDSLLAISAIPFAVCGGVLGLWLSGLNLSVSAAVGFISLFGVSAMDGILLVSCIRQNVADGLDTEHAIIDAARTRMRQIFMTGLSACIGLVPSAISTGIGSQVQRPLACVIVGGMLLSPLFSLTIIPALARLVFPLIPVGLGHESDAAPSEELASPEQASAAELGAEL